MKEEQQGRLLQVIGGFYYVEAADTVYECKARGILRQQGISPVAGDRVTVTVSENGKGVVEGVLPRRNVLVRPPVANLDCLAIVVSLTQPRPHLLLVDKMIALAEHHDIEPIVIVTKTDLDAEPFPIDVYRNAGFSVFSTTVSDPTSVASLKEYLRGKATAFTGNSGVGKSTLLNLLDPSLMRETGEISQKLGRGRHTTRSAVLIPLLDGGYWVDTPGFSSLDTERVAVLDKESVGNCFREFDEYATQCRFTGCSHVSEPDCAVRNAVERGAIAGSRYDSYVAMYKEAQKRKQW
ncbi:MAG: ribosome small subunit-dependent GTPase A [Clostridia bacterium]|nr:ribosome small subunit-dependent GTPase A [Clostridia bacterium]